MSPRRATEPAERTAKPWRKKVVIAALAAAVLAGPSVAQAAPQAAAPQAAPASQGQRAAAASITWTLERASNPTADQRAAYDLITAAMNAAVAR
jgi:Ni/Co efflux regulator RcnB